MAAFLPIAVILTKIISKVASIEVRNCLQTKPGKVCGFEEQVLGKTLVAHLGIPYAQPPVGSLRFRAPQPLEKWDAPVDGTKYGNGCLQERFQGEPRELTDFLESFGPKMSETSEDCLFLDIRAPKGAEDLSVMVNIHGGGFTTGSGSVPVFQSRGLPLEGSVVYVSINYRLGMLGFGYLGTNEMPGNMGLLDQRLALQWIKDNIAQFGGNPENITIFGQSAGGASVAMHLVADGSRKLFTSAIVQSGSMFSNWAVHTTETARKNALDLARYFNCTGENNDTVDDFQTVECLRDVPGQNLTTSSIDEVPTFAPFSIPVQQDVQFFGGNMFELLSTQSFLDFKIMIGFTKEEASLFFPLFTNFTMESYNINNWYVSQGEYYAMTRTIYGFNVDNATFDALIDKYDSMPNVSDIWRLINVLSDYSMICPTLQFARFMAKSNPTGLYLYRFDYVAQEPVMLPTGLGATHASDVPFTLGNPLADEGWGENDKTFSRELVGYWSNLANKGVPTSDWPPMTSSDDPRMRILQLGSSEVTTELPYEICDLLQTIQPAYKSVKIEQ